MLERLGCGEDKEEGDGKPKPFPPPKGLEKFCINAIKGLGALALLAYFAYLLSSLIDEFVENTENPPFAFTQIVPKTGSGEPNFFPFVVCNTGDARYLNLYIVQEQIRGNSSSLSACFPKPELANLDTPCSSNFPAGVNMWRIIISGRTPPTLPKFRQRRLAASGAKLESDSPERRSAVVKNRKLMGSAVEVEAARQRRARRREEERRGGAFEADAPAAASRELGEYEPVYFPPGATSAPVPPTSQPTARPGSNPNEYEYEAPPVVNPDSIKNGNSDKSGTYNCVAVNATGLPGFAYKWRLPVRRQLLMFFEFGKAPASETEVVTIGLDGIDIFVFESVDDIPGANEQHPTPGNPFNFTTPKIAAAEDFVTKVIDQAFAGAGLLTDLGFKRTDYLFADGTNVTDYSQQTTLVAPLDAKEMFGLLRNYSAPPPANATATLGVLYATDLIDQQKESPPTIAAIFGSVGGIKSICQAFFVALVTALLMTHNSFAMAEGRRQRARAEPFTNAGANVVASIEARKVGGDE